MSMMAGTENNVSSGDYGNGETKRTVNDLGNGLLGRVNDEIGIRRGLVDVI